MKMKSSASSLYIHIPFCKHICSYCDFAKVIYNPVRIEAYFKSLFFELKQLPVHKYKTIYIGGGTPSCIHLDLLESLLIQLENRLCKSYEFTIECNIEDLQEDFLQMISSHKVNRLSCGVQTFQEKYIQLFNRHHTKEMVFNHISRAKKYIDNISIDMIYALPMQTIEEVKEDVHLALSLPITHLSYYSLLIEENTILHARHFQNMDEQVQADYYYYIHDELKNHGFNRYEISNFAKKGYESRHNLVYWHNKHYEAIGLHASGYINNIRFTNTRNIEKYINHQYEQEKIILSLDDIIFEDIMLHLRLDEGLNIKEFNKKYPIDFLSTYQQLIKKLVAQDLLQCDNKVVKATLRGSLLLNDILINF